MKLTPFEYNKAKGEGMEEKSTGNNGYFGYSFRMTKWMSDGDLRYSRDPFSKAQLDDSQK